jgi:hypothetical protein
MSPIHRLHSQIHPSAIVVVGAATIAAAHISDLLASKKADGTYKDIRAASAQECSNTLYSRRVTCERGLHRQAVLDYDGNDACQPQPAILASSPAIEQLHSTSNNNSSSAKHNTIECDYVVIGHGRAGKSAVRTLRALDPSANVVVIDPFNVHPSSGNKNTSRRRNNGSIQNIPTRATSINHSQKMVQISPIKLSTLDSPTRKVHYRKSILLATGSRGAPPPEECIGPDSKSRVLELRSTSVPTFNKERPQNQLPILDPATVRSLALAGCHCGSYGQWLRSLGTGCFFGSCFSKNYQ